MLGQKCHSFRGDVDCKVASRLAIAGCERVSNIGTSFALVAGHGRSCLSDRDPSADPPRWSIAVSASQIMASYLAAVAQARASTITWHAREPVPNGPTGVEAVGRTGVAPGVILTVARVVDHGRESFDGALFFGTTLVHLLPEDAKSFWELAEKGT